MYRFPLVTLVAAILVSISGCASGSRSPASLSPPDGDQARAAHLDVKSLEYEGLRQEIAQIHASSLINPNGPRIFEVSKIDSYGLELEREYCPANVSKPNCTKRVNQAIMSALSQRYFAADPVAVQRTCAGEPLICDDLNALETLYLHLHNQSIVQSEREKLSLIDRWKRGQISDDELKSALHVDFKVEDGKLVLTPTA